VVLLCSGAYHGYVVDDEEKHHRWFEELARLLGDGTVKCHLTRRLKLSLAGLKEAHRENEAGSGIGKTAVGVDEVGPDEAFC
jgi:NADPH:quinone reductase-like Zn-dependent oxidoreductase